MTTRQNKYIYILIFLAVSAIFFALYKYHSKHDNSVKKTDVSSLEATSVYSTKVSGYSLSLLKNGTEIQTLALGDDAAAGMNLLGDDTDAIQPFITNQDVNFDGYADVAMLTGVGYGGVNLFYQYYLFDPAAEKFVASAVLADVGNPVFNVDAETITADARDAQDSFKTVYTFDGTRYVKGPTISDTTGIVQSDQ